MYRHSHNIYLRTRTTPLAPSCRIYIYTLYLYTRIYYCIRKPVLRLFTLVVVVKKKNKKKKIRFILLLYVYAYCVSVYRVMQKSRGCDRESTRITIFVKDDGSTILLLRYVPNKDQGPDRTGFSSIRKIRAFSWPVAAGFSASSTDR